MKKQYLAVILIAAIVVTAAPIVYLSIKTKPTSEGPITYTYRIVNEFPHNTSCFTQGLVFENEFLFEGTGLYGSSTLRKVEIETGKTVQLYTLSDEYFGEGITILNGKIFQLTWLERKGFVYDKHSFELLEEFSYSSEGWGITNDGMKLIMSDGSSTLSFLDPTTFELLGQVQVHDAHGPIDKLNELEFIKGDVYANIWQEDKIAVIDLETGQIKAWINLEGIYTPEIGVPTDVLNGIAYDANEDRLFVTGKLWSKLFEITLLPT